MRSAKSFSEVLGLGGRIVLFTASAGVALRFEQHCDRHHVRVICTRGLADHYVAMSEWHRIHATREHALLSCDQRHYPRAAMPATDLIWIGETGDLQHVPHVWRSFLLAMSCSISYEPVRKWLLDEDSL